MHDIYKRKANNALGVLVICGMFFVETTVADHAQPNPATRLVWTMLGLMTLVSLVAYVWFRRKAAQAAREQSAEEQR
jgi:type VI protein secretion system component VasK